MTGPANVRMSSVEYFNLFLSVQVTPLLQALLVVNLFANSTRIYRLFLEHVAHVTIGVVGYLMMGKTYIDVMQKPVPPYQPLISPKVEVIRESSTKCNYPGSISST